jgi:hypothetical protein
MKCRLPAQGIRCEPSRNEPGGPVWLLDLDPILIMQVKAKNVPDQSEERSIRKTTEIQAQLAQKCFEAVVLEDVQVSTELLTVNFVAI